MGGGTMSMLIPLPVGLRLLDFQHGPPVVMYLALSAKSARCPCCQRHSRGVHSHYWRTLADLPLGGQPVCLRLQIRRFFCRNRRCQQRIFAERMPELAADYAQRTLRLRQAQICVAQAVGSRPGVRLSQALSMGTSATTLLRLERGQCLPSFPTPRVLGVDDWAFRKGHRYGTILYDQERHLVVDLLPDRTAHTLANWLQEHPGVEIVTRDRAEAYAEGIRQGAPTAQQIADRFHLVKNLAESVTEVLDNQRTLIQQAHREVLPQTLPSPQEPIVVVDATPKPHQQEACSPSKEVKQTPAAALKCRHRQQRLERYEQVQALRRQGLSQVAISRRLQLNYMTVRRWIKAEGFPERRERTYTQPRFRILAAYEDYLRTRCEAGCHNASTLFGELRKQGYSGSYELVKRFVRRFRPSNVSVCATSTPLSTRQVVAWAMKPEPERTPQQNALLQRLTELCAPFQIARNLLDRFLTMIRHSGCQDQVAALQLWLGEAHSCGLACLHRFAASLEQDLSAVEAGLSFPWNNGPVEGNVNRLKFLKRRGYGRANFDLLRRRVLQPTRC